MFRENALLLNILRDYILQFYSTYKLVYTVVYRGYSFHIKKKT